MSAKFLLRPYWLLLLVSGVIAGGVAQANEPAPAPTSSAAAPGTKIIFSGANSNTVSANPNELRSPASPFQKLESGLKKPFDVFDPVGRSDVRPARPPVSLPQTPPKRSLKEQLNDRAEEMFLNPELYQDKNNDQELFGLTEEAGDPYKAAPRNALDRYQDRMERENPTRTNSTRTTDLFGEQRDALDRSAGFSLTPKPLATMDPMAPTPNRPAGQGLFTTGNEPETTSTGRPLPRAFDSSPSGNLDSFQQRRITAAESRRENYQRLLSDPGFARQNLGAISPEGQVSNPNPYPNPYQTTPTARSANPMPGVTPMPSWSTPRPAAVSGNTSFSDVAGSVGGPREPKALPEYTVSATFTEMRATPAQPVAPAPIFPNRPTKFQIPQRTY
jgi:hypothetical protein